MGKTVALCDDIWKDTAKSLCKRYLDDLVGGYLNLIDRAKRTNENAYRGPSKFYLTKDALVGAGR